MMARGANQPLGAERRRTAFDLVWCFARSRGRSLAKRTEHSTGPDLTKGIPITDLTEVGMILGQVAGEAVVLARNGGTLFSIGAERTHYRPLSEGVLVADTVRCPWQPCLLRRSLEFFTRQAV